MRNEQPFEANGPGGYDAIGGSRDERALGHADRSQQQQQQRDASLAMRAFNTDRFIQHLASGRPLTSFESLFGAGKTGAGKLEKGPQQQGQYLVD